MNTKTIKTISCILMVIALVSSIATVVNASAITPANLNASYNGTNDIVNVGQSIMGIVQTVGVVVAVVILMVLGIKYMMGSAEEKAEYKKTMMPYIIGAVLIFAATTIANAVYNFATGL